MSLPPKYDFKTYDAKSSCLFRKTKEQFGGLSNMASGFPLRVNNINILSAEALYQLCKFPHLPNVQEKILNEKSPMTAKMVCKPYVNQKREDWEFQKIKVMRWCLKVKLAQNFAAFGMILESTLDKIIVEDSGRDNFWGAIRLKENRYQLKGVNALGRLLMELRKIYNDNRYTYDIFVVEPLIIKDFLILGEPIRTIDARKNFISFLNEAIHINSYDCSNPLLSNIETTSFLNKEINLVNALENDFISNTREDNNLIGKKSKSKKQKSNDDNQTSLPF